MYGFRRLIELTVLVLLLNVATSLPVDLSGVLSPGGLRDQDPVRLGLGGSLPLPCLSGSCVDPCEHLPCDDLIPRSGLVPFCLVTTGRGRGPKCLLSHSGTSGLENGICLNSLDRNDSVQLWTSLLAMLI